MVPKIVVLVVVLRAICLRSVSGLTCFQCSGDTCTNEATIASVVQCPDGEVSCFAQFTGFLLTRRGCWSELEGTVPDADCAGGDCAKCETDYCNGLSRTTHTCVTCSSVADERCTSDPGAIAPTQCGAATMDVAGAQCFSRIVGSVTERGCVRSEQTVEACTGPTCQTCAGEGCNAVVFPTGRQKCVSCSGAGCNAQTDTGYCEQAYDNCVTLQRTDGTYVKSCEAAMATADQTFCQANPGRCSFCGQLECNKAALNVATSRKCYRCEGTGCLKASVDIETCHNSDDVCFSMFDGFNPVRRGCKSQLSEPERAQCDDAGDKSCQTCLTDGCNLDSHVDHKCEYCSSVLEASCITAPNSEVRCPAPTTEVSADAQCYTRVIGSVTERGCLGSAADALECDSTESCQTCAIANGQPCNKAVFPADRIRCVVGATANQYCPDPSDSCVQIANNGATITKKCQSSMTAAEVSFCEANSNKCDFCWADNCNQQTIAFNYLECFSCQSTIDGHCTTNPSAIDTVDHCTTCATLFSASTNTLKRGCLSSLTAAEQATCSAGGTSCSTCTTNRCNRAVFPQERLSCYSCAQGECHSHDGINLEFCPNYRQGDSCVTRLDSSGKVTWLGCWSSLSASQQATCSGSSANCRQCSGSGCNNPANPVGAPSCVQCKSSTDPDCIGGASSFVVQPCNDPLNQACYSRLASTGVTERGCFNDLDATSKVRCSAGTDCRMCNTRARCNSLEFPIQIKCFQCDSKQSPECKNAQLGAPSYCPSYNVANKCFTVVQENGDTVRKCGTGTRDATCASAKLCEQCLFSGCNKRVSTKIMPTVIAKPVVPGRSSANGRFVIGGHLTLIVVIIVTVRNIFMR